MALGLHCTYGGLHRCGFPARPVRFASFVGIIRCLYQWLFDSCRRFSIKTLQGGPQKPASGSCHGLKTWTRIHDTAVRVILVCESEPAFWIGTFLLGVTPDKANANIAPISASSLLAYPQRVRTRNILQGGPMLGRYSNSVATATMVAERTNSIYLCSSFLHYINYSSWDIPT